MGKKVLTPKRIAIFGAVVSLASFSYKLTIAILATSLVLIIASFAIFELPGLPRAVRRAPRFGGSPLRHTTRRPKLKRPKGRGLAHL